MTTGKSALEFLDQRIKKDFDANRRILSFDDYLSVISENPKRHSRGSATYSVDMMDHFGKEPVGSSGSVFRFKVFEKQSDSDPQVVGQERVQSQIYRALKSFSRQGINNRLILLHGPNGSAKSSIAHSLMAGLEKYSHQPEGALYTFNWVFPIERYTKGGIGLNTYTAQKEPINTYAKLPDDEVAARINCDLRDHPLLIVPAENRFNFLQTLLGSEKAAREAWDAMPTYLRNGELCHRCKQIADALLLAHNGDFKRVAMHVQVERFYFARRYRRGLVTIEPQVHVDAQYQMLTYNKSIGSLPSTLLNINLFALTGDLAEGNRGMIEYSDLLKRPVDAFKYLLGACETASVNIGNSIAYLDMVMLGSTNELQLDGFKEFPDFTSFKGRIDLIRVPYLTSVSKEKTIYADMLPQVAGEKHISPHLAWTAALWAVLTRLKKPNSINFAPGLSTLMASITPIEKARLYDTGELPSNLSAEDRKVLKSNLDKVEDEYINVPYYEGRMGASAREIKSILFDAAQNPEFPCLSPLAVLREIEQLVKHVTEYEFLKQDIKDGYHDAAEFVNTVRNEYLVRIDREVRDSMGLYDSKQWEEFLRKYVQHLALFLKKEKLKNSITGKMEEPDFSLIEELEKIVEAPGKSGKSGADELAAFRQNIISQVGAWSLDHPGQPVVYAEVFPEFWKRLEKHYFDSQKPVLTKMHDVLLVYGRENSSSAFSGGASIDPEGAQLARQTVQNMVSRLGYCEHCAKEVITFLMRQRY